MFLLLGVDFNEIVKSGAIMKNMEKFWKKWHLFQNKINLITMIIFITECCSTKKGWILNY